MRFLQGLVLSLLAVVLLLTALALVYPALDSVGKVMTAWEIAQALDAPRKAKDRKSVV